MEPSLSSRILASASHLEWSLVDGLVLRFRIHGLAKWIDWWPNLVIHEGLSCKDAYFTIENRPGLGVEINPSVAKTHWARESGGDWQLFLIALLPRQNKKLNQLSRSE
jgi:L-alanine-DL-glutamate epimerase-like enolase superfamily enzyme